MLCRKFNIPAMAPLNVAFFLIFLTLLHFSAAQKPPPSKWKTLDGFPPFVVARGGVSGLFPDSSSYAYNMAMMTSVPDLILWCDVQLSKDGVGVCLPSIMLNNATNVEVIYPNKANSYVVDGAKKDGFFPIDLTLKELNSLSLIQGLYSRPPNFDGSLFQIQTVEDVFTQNKPYGFWLNIEHPSFYSQHKLNMRSYIMSTLKTVIISHISSPEISFLQELSKPLATTPTKLIFRFRDQAVIEPSTNQTYGSLSKNLTFIKSFASGILVPKSYIWPVDPTSSYLLPHTSLVADAHKLGIEVFASDFANDNVIAYNYSYNPVSEYLSFMDNDEFSVEGVLTDFPLTASEAIDCFAFAPTNVSAKAKPLVISHLGASGDYPGCTDISYTTAISDGADVIDCPVQMSKDGVPFCLSSANLMNSTLVTQTQFRTLLTTVSEIQSGPGIFSFSLNWADIKGLTPVISSPYSDSFLYRNPKFRNFGSLISLSDFLDLAKNASSLSAVLIKIENAKYLAADQSLSVTDAVVDALEKAGYNNNATKPKKVMIQSTNSAVLKALKGKQYELVYEVDELIRDALNATIADIKTFANSVVVKKESVYPTNMGFLVSMTDVVSHIQAFKLPVYVQILRNEFVDIAYDFFSDPIVEINSYVMGAQIDGLITEYPQSAAAYKRNLCLSMKPIPMYMSPVQPGQLITLVTAQLLPPAEAPNPVLEADDVSEPPLPAVVPKNDKSPTSSTAETPKASPSGQHQITASALLSSLSIILAVCLLL